MKLAAIAGIHRNCVALEAVLADIAALGYANLKRTSRGWSVMFRHVPYDHLSMTQLARSNGLPVWADALATGWVE